MHIIKSFVVLIIFCVLFSTAFAGQKIYVSGGYAIKGMDTVAYFTKNKAIRGSKEFSYEWEEAIWLFENKEHMDLFINDPEKYAPAYGGWCAFGVVERGMLVWSAPRTTWDIINNRLFFQAREAAARFNKTASSIAKGDKIWKKIGQK